MKTMAWSLIPYIYYMIYYILIVTQCTMGNFETWYWIKITSKLLQSIEVYISYYLNVNSHANNVISIQNNSKIVKWKKKKVNILKAINSRKRSKQ